MLVFVFCVGVDIGAVVFGGVGVGEGEFVGVASGVSVVSTCAV